MQILLVVLNRVEMLQPLLDSLMEKGFSGATILNSTGMMKELAKNIEQYPILGSLRFLLNEDHRESKTIFMVVKEEQAEAVKAVVREVVGDLSQPDTAIMCTLPLLSVEGVGF